jgi:hypothetical protein
MDAADINSVINGVVGGAIIIMLVYWFLFS